MSYFCLSENPSWSFFVPKTIFLSVRKQKALIFTYYESLRWHFLKENSRHSSHFNPIIWGNCRPSEQIFHRNDPLGAKVYSLFITFTAQDRKRALSLKSHVRVISSHQPVRVSQLTGDKRSSYDSMNTQSPGQLSLDSNGVAGLESSLLTDNFTELLLDPVDVQLQKLLGSDAEDFLHPTFREGAKKTLNPMAVVQRKCMYAC